MSNESMMPPVGAEVQAWFGGNKYRATVIKHGRVAPHIRFKLKNGRVIQGRATILPHGASLGCTYRGYLAQMFHPDFYVDQTTG